MRSSRLCGALGLALALPGCARAPVAPVAPAPVQPPDCVAVVRNRWDTDLPVRFAAFSPGQRDQCLDQLLRVVADPKPTVDPGPVAGGVEALARAGLISDASVFGPLIECLKVQDLINAAYCNRAIEALTRHKYGHGMFAGTRGAPARTATSRDEVIGDWVQLLRPLQKGRPIFDADLKQLCANTMRALGGGLAGSLAPFLKQTFNPAGGYLNAFKDAPSIPNGDGEEIFRFAIGEGEGFDLPANWRATPMLKGLRFVLFRPGIAKPSSVSRFDLKQVSGAHPFPVDLADYREVFQALDLEFRYQVVTSSDELRKTTVAAVRDALRELREANVVAGGL